MVLWTEEKLMNEEILNGTVLYWYNSNLIHCGEFISVLLILVSTFYQLNQPIL